VLTVICLLYFFVFNGIVYGLDTVPISSVRNDEEASAVRITEDAPVVQNTVEALSSKTCGNEEDVDCSHGHSLVDTNDTFGSIYCLSFVLLVLSYSFSLSATN
jgi:hypothetical protein